MLNELAPTIGAGEEVFKPLVDDPNKALIEAQNTLGRYINFDETDWSDIREQLKLAELFAQLPLTIEDLEEIAGLMDLDRGLISWDRPSVQNTWFSIIQRTFEEGKSIPNLISTTVPYFHEQYGDPDAHGE